MGVILVTHNFGVVADLCDRVIGDAERPGRRDRPGPGHLQRRPAPVHQVAAGRHPRGHEPPAVRSLSAVPATAGDPTTAGGPLAALNGVTP